MEIAAEGQLMAELRGCLKRQQRLFLLNALCRYAGEAPPAPCAVPPSVHRSAAREWDMGDTSQVLDSKPISPRLLHDEQRTDHVRLHRSQRLLFRGLFLFDVGPMPAASCRSDPAMPPAAGAVCGQR